MGSERLKIIVLPKYHQSTELWTELALRQKEFRLLSLKLAAEHFQSPYEREVQFDLKVWKDRLSNPLAITFVAIRTDEEHEGIAKDDVEEALTLEWLGSLVVTGPLDEQAARVSTAMGPITVASPRAGVQVETPPLHYHFNAVFVLPAARGQGIAAKLINYAAARITEICRREGAGNIRFTLQVRHNNVPARRLYEKCGFRVIRTYFYEDKRCDEGVVEAAYMELNVDL